MRKRVRAALAVALAAVLASSVSVDAQDRGDAVPPPREAVWRAIFARPETKTEDDAEAAKAGLGHDLFRDVRLSGGGRASCATCHDPSRAFTDGRKTGVGPGGATLPRNVPTLYNLAWATSFFWDGRAATLSDQARSPILARDELDANFHTIEESLASDATMRARFAVAFPTSPAVSEADILAALAAYERTLVSPKTRFDAWVEGDDAALSDKERQGFDIFVGKGGCVSCHGGWRFTDDSFHDIGLPSRDLGRGALAPGSQGLPEFKTPSLREAVHTAPYMHDGSLATLADVVDHYAGGLVHRPSLAPTIVADLKLTSEEKQALVDFLTTLSSTSLRRASDETSRPMIKK